MTAASLPLVLPLALSLAASSSAQAAPADLSDAELAARGELLATYGALVDPDASFLDGVALPPPADLDLHHELHGPSCLTGLVMELQEQRHLFDDREWSEISTTLHLPGSFDAPPIEAEGDVSCVGDTAANFLASEHFVVYFHDGDDAKAEALVESLEYSWDQEIDVLDWKQPVGSDRYKLRFLISDQGYAGAYTTVDYCAGVGYMPYMVTGRGSFSGGSWYKTMAAHEFNHAIQFGYGFAHEFFWWEATATWVEEHIYPENNDWADMYWAFSQYPHIGLNAFSQRDQEIFYHMYAMGIFGTYLDEYVGGHDFVQDTWNYVDGDYGQYDQYLPDAIDDMGESFVELWAGFQATTAFMDFEEYRYYVEPNTTDSVSSLPASGGGGSKAPQSLGLNYIEIDGSAGAEGKYLQVDLAGDDSVEWIAVLVTGSGNSVTEYVPFTVEAGVGSAWIPFDGSDDAFLVVSPMDEDAQGYGYDWERADEFDYEWEACLVDDVTGVPCGEDPDLGDSGDDSPATPDDEETAGGCGCATPAAPAVGFVWALGLLGVAARRRRS